MGHHLCFPAVGIRTINILLKAIFQKSLLEVLEVFLSISHASVSALRSVEDGGSQQTRHSFKEGVLVLRVHGFIGVQLQREGGIARCERSQDGGIAL